MEKVIVYSTPDCPYCSQVKEYLKRKGIDFVDYDVSKDQEKLREMMAKSRQNAVPVIEINGRIIVGFRRDDIDRALARKNIDPALLKQNLSFDLLDQ